MSASSTFVEIMEALAGQLIDTLEDPGGVELHIEPLAFSIAETPAIDLMIPGSSGLEDGLAGFGSETRYGAFPLFVRVRVGTADVYTGERLLIGLMDDLGPLSIVAALDADRTLGGVVDTLTWGNGFPWTGYEDFPMSDGNGVLLGSKLPLVIVKTQS